MIVNTKHLSTDRDCMIQCATQPCYWDNKLEMSIFTISLQQVGQHACKECYAYIHTIQLNIHTTQIASDKLQPVAEGSPTLLNKIFQPID